MRVAQLVETMAAGGAEALAIDVAGALAERGHESHLYVVRGDGPFRDRVDERVTFHDLAQLPLKGGPISKLSHFLGISRVLESRLRDCGIDVLQTHLPMANFLGLVMARRGICRVYPTVHNNREFEYGPSQGALRRTLRRTAYRQMLLDCSGVIAVSEQVKQSLVEQLHTPARQLGRIRVVPNGVNVPPEPSLAERMDKRAEWGVPGDELLIVGAGRLTRQKNFGALLDALTLLPESVPKWRCIVAGDGELHRVLTEQLNAVGFGDCVRLVGLVKDLPGLLSAADIFCLPSSYEGLPLVLLEAMAAGLPTVGFAIDGVSDVLTDKAQGRLVKPGDVAGLAEALGSLLCNAEERRRFGAAARSAVIRDHGFQTVVNRLESVYSS